MLLVSLLSTCLESPFSLRCSCRIAWPQVDAIETGSHYQLHVALPGITKGLALCFSASMVALHRVQSICASHLAFLGRPLGSTWTLQKGSLHDISLAAAHACYLLGMEPWGPLLRAFQMCMSSVTPYSVHRTKSLHKSYNSAGMMQPPACRESARGAVGPIPDGVWDAQGRRHGHALPGKTRRSGRQGPRPEARDGLRLLFCLLEAARKLLSCSLLPMRILMLMIRGDYGHESSLIASEAPRAPADPVERC